MKIGISNHQLMIETGRYNQTPHKDRFCPVCNSGIIEDEFHSLLNCSKYSIPREKYYNQMQRPILSILISILYQCWIWKWCERCRQTQAPSSPIAVIMWKPSIATITGTIFSAIVAIIWKPVGKWTKCLSYLWLGKIIFFPEWPCFSKTPASQSFT